MTALYLIVSMLAGVCFYCSTPHQRLCTPLATHPVMLRGIGGVLFVIAVNYAVQAIGLLPGFFAALTSLMLSCVLLPYLDAWWTGTKLDGRGVSDVE